MVDKTVGLAYLTTAVPLDAGPVRFVLVRRTSPTPFLPLRRLTTRQWTATSRPLSAWDVEYHGICLKIMTQLIAN